MNKPREVEEVWDTYLIRPLGFLLVQVLRRIPIVTPNMVSVAGMLASIVAAWFYYHQDLRGAIGGLVFLALSSVFDSADGQLARVTQRQSALGRLIDGVCDNVSFVAIYIAVLMSWLDRGQGYGVAMFFVALIAGVSHSTHCALTDYARLLFLFYCYGSKETINDQPEMLRQRIEEVRRQGSWMWWFFLRLNLNYSYQQQGLLPTSAALQRRFLALVEKKPELKEWFIALYREQNTRIVSRWALVGPNAHKVGIIAASFVPVFFQDGWLGYLGTVLFYVYNFGLTLIMFALMRAQRRVDERLLEALERRAAG